MTLIFCHCSLNWQHWLCKHSINVVEATLFSDHNCDTANNCEHNCDTANNCEHNCDTASARPSLEIPNSGGFQIPCVGQSSSNQNTSYRPPISVGLLSLGSSSNDADKIMIAKMENPNILTKIVIGAFSVPQQSQIQWNC